MYNFWWNTQKRKIQDGIIVTIEPIDGWISYFSEFLTPWRTIWVCSEMNFFLGQQEIFEEVKTREILIGIELGDSFSWENISRHRIWENVLKKAEIG